MQVAPRWRCFTLQAAPRCLSGLLLVATLASVSALSPGCGSGSAGAPGPAGPTYSAGPGISITGTTIAVASGGVSSAMLSATYAPATGAPGYLWSSPGSPQAAGLAITGDASMGGTLIAGGVSTGNMMASGTVSAARFSGDGSSLTSLPAGQLTGTIPDALLSANVPLLTAGRIPQSVLPTTVALIASVPSLGGDNSFAGATTFSGAVAFASLVAPPSAGPPAAGPQGAAAAGRLYFDTQSQTLQVHDGTSWRILAFTTSFGPRTATATVATAGAISIPGFGSFPAVTVWAMASGGTAWADVTGNPAYPTSYAGGTVTVTNNSGTTQGITISAVGP
jgi:hypothetical protein